MRESCDEGRPGSRRSAPRASAPRASTSGPSCRRRWKSSRRRLRRSGGAIGAPSSSCSASRWPGQAGRDRHRRVGARQGVVERPQQDHPAVRDRRGARDPRPRRASVKAGDVLIELDPTMDQAEEEHLHSDLVAAELDVARYRAALSEDAMRSRTSCPRRSGPSARRQRPRRAGRSDLGAARQARRARSSGRAEGGGDRHGAGAVDKLETVIPLQQQRVDMRKMLLAKGLESGPLSAEAQDLVSNQQELAVQKSREKEAEAASRRSWSSGRSSTRSSGGRCRRTGQGRGEGRRAQART